MQSLSDILAKDYQENPLISNLVDENEGTIICGPPGLGKSAFTNLISLNGANPPKEDLFGYFYFARPFSTLFFQSEIGAKQTKNRCKLLIKHWPDLSKGLQMVHYLGFGNTGRVTGSFSNPAFQHILLNAIIETNADLVIVDPLISFAAEVGENSNEGMRIELDNLKRVCEYAGASVIVIHHTRKDGRELRGASSIEGWTDRIILLEPFQKDGEQCFKMVFKKTRNQADQNPISIKKNGLKFERISGAREEDADVVVNALNQLGGKVANQKDLLVKIAEISGLSNSTALRKVKNAVRDVKVEEINSGRSLGYQLITVSDDD